MIKDRCQPAIALLLFFTGALVVACQDDLKNTSTISSKEVETSKVVSYGAEMIYSDSAIVKAKMTAPVFITYQGNDPYDEMPKGVTVIFYDKDHQEQNRVRSDYATRKENQKVTELRDHVVITTRSGDTYHSEQIFWDENTRKFYSSKLLKRVSKKGEIGYASSFESDENFLHPKFYGGSGDILVPEKEGP